MDHIHRAHHPLYILQIELFHHSEKMDLFGIHETIIPEIRNTHQGYHYILIEGKP